MTKQDIYQLFGLLQAVYPDAFRGLSDSAAQVKLNVWQDIFRDDPAEQVMAAARTFISRDKKGFMPVPGQLREILEGADAMGEQEAWALVTRALRRSTYYSHEEFEKLPQPIRRALGTADTLRSWAQVNVSELETVIASHFKRDYRAIAALTTAPVLPAPEERGSAEKRICTPGALPPG